MPEPRNPTHWRCWDGLGAMTQSLTRRRFVKSSVGATVGFVTVARGLLGGTPAFASRPCSRVYCEPEGVICDEKCILWAEEYCYDFFTHDFCWIMWTALGECSHTTP